MKIKISEKVVSQMVSNQDHWYKGVFPDGYTSEDQVNEHFTSENNNAGVHIKEIMKEVKLTKKMKILDLGCGYGLMLTVFRKMGFDVYGCDVHDISLNIAKQVLKENSISSKYIRRCGDILPYDNSSFDFIYMNQVVQYIGDLDRFFKEIHRILKKGGKMYFVCPNYQCCYDIEYQLFFIPWLPKVFNKLYLKLLKRNPDFWENVNFVTKRKIEKIFRIYGFKYWNLGINYWEESIANTDLAGRGEAFKRLILFLNKYHFINILKIIARFGFYTPLVYVLEKE